MFSDDESAPRNGKTFDMDKIVNRLKENKGIKCDQRQIVNLNVGGTKFTTRYETLLTGNSTYFSNFIVKQKENGKIVILPDRFIKDETGAIFINRDGHLFSYVLQYMRDRRFCVLPNDIGLIDGLLREADFFGLVEYRDILSEKKQLIELKNGGLEDDVMAIRKLLEQMTSNGDVHRRGLQRKMN